jgi:hypothetical protein
MRSPSLKLPLSFAVFFTAAHALAQDPAPAPAPAAPAAPPAAAPPAAEAPKPDAPPVVQMDDTAGQAPPAGAAAPVSEPVAPSQPEATTPGAAAGPASAAGPPPGGSDEWKFEFHGYLRAPMRVGIGKRDTKAPGQSGTTYHSPVIPDDQYLSWQHTLHNQKDWAELFFSYGNSWAKGTVGLQGFNFTDAAWTDPDAQFGISQGFVTLTPELPWENVRLTAKVGSFWNKYGSAGKYDAGHYDTYLFGRTHAMGETLRIELDVNQLTFGFEHGIGAKRPDPSTFTDTKFTLLHHVHGDVTFDKWATLGLHYLSSWAQEEDRVGTLNPPSANLPDGKLDVYGAELKLDANMFGYFYAGFSHISADDAVTVAPAIEVLHAYGGGQFNLGVTDNYLDSRGCTLRSGAPTLGRAPCSGGNGSVNSILAQYEFSVANLLTNLESPGTRFWGEGRDFVIALYGMFNQVESENKCSASDPTCSSATEMDGVKKFKFGTDLEFSALSWFGIGTRFDRVQPNSRIPEQSFSVLSPRLIFRSKWVTHEEIQVQYSRYIYNQRTCELFNNAVTGTGAAEGGVTPADAGWEVGEERCVQPPTSPALPDGFGSTALNGDRGAPTFRPDVNVFKVQASMWW